jgi:hypothetical protein
MEVLIGKILKQLIYSASFGIKTDGTLWSWGRQYGLEY